MTLLEESMHEVLLVLTFFCKCNQEESQSCVYWWGWLTMYTQRGLKACVPHTYRCVALKRWRNRMWLKHSVCETTTRQINIGFVCVRVCVRPPVVLTYFVVSALIEALFLLLIWCLPHDLRGEGSQLEEGSNPVFFFFYIAPSHPIIISR